MQNAFAATSNQKNMVCQTAFRRKRNRPLEGGTRPPAEPVVEAPPFWKDIEPGYVDSQKDGPVGSDGH